MHAAPGNHSWFGHRFTLPTNQAVRIIFDSRLELGPQRNIYLPGWWKTKGTPKRKLILGKDSNTCLTKRCRRHLPKSQSYFCTHDSAFGICQNCTIPECSQGPFRGRSFQASRQLPRGWKELKRPRVGHGSESCHPPLYMRPSGHTYLPHGASAEHMPMETQKGGHQASRWHHVAKGGD